MKTIIKGIKEFFVFRRNTTSVVKVLLLLLFGFFSAISSAQTGAPTVQDCLGAIPLCQSSYSTTNAYSGTGNYTAEINPSISCLGSGEKNDVWYIFTVSTSGNLNFSITPNNPNDDYDWAVFNLTSASCGDIFNNANLQVSCDYAPNMGCGGVTGPNGNYGLEGCQAQNKPVIPVSEGQTYVINVSQFSSSQAGYTIDFSASTAQIYDRKPPEFLPINPVAISGSSALDFSFSERIACNTVEASDFVLQGPGGPYTITNVSSNECGAGAVGGKSYTVDISPSISNVGTYSLLLNGTITDQCGNTSYPISTSFTVDCNVPGFAAAKPTITPLGNTTFCTGDAVILRASAASGYRWNTGDETQEISVTQAGNYYVTVSNQSGCTSTSDVVSIFVSPKPVLLASPQFAIVPASCGSATGTIQVVPPSVPSGTSIEYSADGGTSWQSSNQFSLLAGTYTVKLKASSTPGCFSISPAGIATITSAISPLQPAKPITEAIPATCGVPMNTIKVVGPAPATGTSFQYSADGITWQTSNLLSVPVPGTYNVYIRAKDIRTGCISTPSEAQVMMMDHATAPAIPIVEVLGSTSLCYGGSVKLVAPPGFSYEWYPSLEKGREITVRAAGSYSVKVTNSSGCSTVSNVVNVSLSSLPQVPSISGLDITHVICGQSTGTVRVLTGTIAPGITLEYSSDAGTSWQSSNEFIKTPGNYSMQVRAVASNGCSVLSRLSTATVKPASSSPAAPQVTAIQPGCGALMGSILVSPSFFGSNYTYSTDGVQFQSSRVFANIVPGTYHVFVKNSLGCISPPTQVTVHSAPASPAIPEITMISGKSALCTGEYVTLQAPAGYTYLWSNGIKTRSITVSKPGNYYVTIMNQNKCTATSASIMVTLSNKPPKPVVTAMGPTTFCQGDSVMLMAPLADQYLWSNGATTRDIVVKTGGNYYVTVSNAAGCSAVSSAKTVTVNSAPAIPQIIHTGSLTFCDGQQTILTAPLASSYLWSNGEKSRSIAVSRSGDFTVRVFNAAGCSSISDTVTVTRLMIAINGPSTLCKGGEATLWTSEGYGSVQWYKNGIAMTGKTSASVTVNEAATYSVSGTKDGNFCTSSGFQLSEIPLPKVNAINSSATRIDDTHYKSCGAANFNLAISYYDKPYHTKPVLCKIQYEDGSYAELETNEFIIAKSGVVEVVLMSEGGCTSSQSFHVQIMDAVSQDPLIASGPTTFCEGESVVLTAPAGYTYLWNNNETGRSITVTKGGEYFVKMTNSNDCVSVSNKLTVIVNPANSNGQE